MNLKALTLAAVSTTFASAIPLEDAVTLTENVIVAGDDATPITAEQLEAGVPEGFAKVFASDSLEGWTQRGGTEAEFSIKDGVLTGKAGQMRHNSFLCSDKVYDDFVIAFQFKFTHLEGNSGFMFRAQPKEGGGGVFGYQCEHDNKIRSWTAGLYDEARRAWLYPIQKITNPIDAAHHDFFTGQGVRIFKPEGWNTIVIKCDGDMVQTWLNGEPRVNFLEPKPSDETRKGFFGFQVHNGHSCEVQWRNVVIKELGE